MKKQINTIQSARPAGPIVVIVSGNISSSEAKALLASVTYEADVTWNENTYFDKKNNVANLLVNVILLCIIVCAISLAAGVAFGGARVLLRRYFPGKVFGHADEEEFISLDLADPVGRSGTKASGNSPQP